MKPNIKRVVEQCLFFLLLILLWQIAYTLAVNTFHLVKSYTLPSPTGVLDSAVSLFQSSRLFLAIGNSLGRCLLGFAISILIGTAFGLAINMIGFLGRNLKPIIMGLQTLPSICWVPFAILWFGLSGNAILFVIIMGASSSCSLSIDDAIHNVNPIYIKVSKTMGASRSYIYKRVILPACMPSFLAGMRQTWSFAWRALMSGEIMVTCVGLGTTLQTARDFNDINQVMLVMIVIILLGVLIDKLVFSTLENIVLRKRGL